MYRSTFYLIVLSLFFTTIADASRHPLFMHPKRSAQNLTNVEVMYYGGPVLSHVKIYTVFWGSDVDATTRNEIGPFYKSLMNSRYIEQLGEYETSRVGTNGHPGTQQAIGKGSYFGEFTIAPSVTTNELTQAKVEQELEHQISAGNLPVPDGNSLYMIHFPSKINIEISWGRSCDVWLADHEYFVSPKFGNTYYALMPTCGTPGASWFNTLTSAASHEIEEAVTDPACPIKDLANDFPAAWLTAGQAEEIGDLCTGTGETQLRTPTATYTLERAYLNSLKSCSKEVFNSN